MLALKPIKNDSNKNDCVQIMIHINAIYGGGVIGETAAAVISSSWDEGSSGVYCWKT